MKKKLATRRQFVKTTAFALAVPAIVPSSVFGNNGNIPPSERICVGMIGVGSHGTGVNLKSYLTQPDARVLAVCDVDSKHLARAAKMVNTKYGNDDCTSYKDFREVLARKDIDTVMISTPDHWHVPMSVMAAKAGKDIQCEKPTLTIDEGKILVNTIRRYGCVFQTSTEDRAIAVYHRMAELVRNGRIGKLIKIEIILPKQPGFAGNPSPQPVPAELDWDMWLGPAPYVPYTKDRVHWNYRWVSDYSGGIICDWGTHLFDTAQWGNDTERSGPVEVEGTGTYWEDGLFDTVKDYDITYRYSNGVVMTCKPGDPSIKFIGTEGWVGNRGWRSRVEASSDEILNSVIGPEEIHLYTNPAGEHREFLDCVKTRKDPYFPVDIGHRVSTVCHLGNLAIKLGRKLKWDTEKEVFVNNEMANRMLSKPMRAPWRL